MKVYTDDKDKMVIFTVSYSVIDRIQFGIRMFILVLSYKVGELE